MRMSRRTTSHVSSAKSSSASRPLAAARTVVAVVLEQASKQLSADVVVVGDEDRSRHRPDDPRRSRNATGQPLGSAAVADVLDKRVLDELRESVGGDQAFVAELIDELLEDAPRQLAGAARGGGGRRRGDGATCGAHAEGQRPHVRRGGARLALPGGGGRRQRPATSTLCASASTRSKRRGSRCVRRSWPLATAAT